MFEPAIIIDASTEAVSLAEMKRQLRLDTSGTAEDDALGIFRTAARVAFENYTGRTVHQKTLEWALGGWPAENYIKLPRATPLIAISSVKYKDSAALETTWSSAEYIADTDSTPGRVVLGYGFTWPSFTKYPVSPIRVRYTAGIATASPITEAGGKIKAAILMLAAGFYANRESEVITDRAAIAAVAQSLGCKWLLDSLVVHY